MNLEEIIKDLEHTISYFKKPITGTQIGRKYQAEKTLKDLKLLNIDDVSNCLECGVEINYKGICDICHCKGTDAYEA